MSSSRASLRNRSAVASGDVAPAKSRAPRKRGPRQPQLEDFQVTLGMPESVPILERELRAIEILLGAELQGLLSSSAKER